MLNPRQFCLLILVGLMCIGAMLTEKRGRAEEVITQPDDAKLQIGHVRVKNSAASSGAL